MFAGNKLKYKVMEKLELLILTFALGSAFGYLVRYLTEILPKEEYQKRLKSLNDLRESRDKKHNDTLIKIKELDEANKVLNRIIIH